MSRRTQREPLRFQSFCKSKCGKIHITHQMLLSAQQMLFNQWKTKHNQQPTTNFPNKSWTNAHKISESYGPFERPFTATPWITKTNIHTSPFLLGWCVCVCLVCFFSGCFLFPKIVLIPFNLMNL